MLSSIREIKYPYQEEKVKIVECSFTCKHGNHTGQSGTFLRNYGNNFVIQMDNGDICTARRIGK